MKVTVTGGAGFIGANLCRHLAGLTEVDDIVVLDDLSTGDRLNLRGLDVDLQVGDLLDPEAVDRAVTGADAVVHLGARPSVPRSIADPLASHAANATGTMHVLEAARHAGGPLVVVASSSSVYGTNPVLPKHEGLVARPASPYAASKLAAESYALAHQRSFGLPVLAGDRIVAVADLKADRAGRKLLIQQWTWLEPAPSAELRQRVDAEMERFERFQLG